MMNQQVEMRSFRARWVFPMAGEPRSQATVHLRDQSVLGIDTDCTSATVDLGNVAILPAWVNAHAHLEFSDLAAPIGTAGIHLAEWIRQVILHRQDRANQLTSSEVIDRGLAESRAAGVACVADIAQANVADHVPAAPMPIWYRLFETRGIATGRSEALLRAALEAQERVGARDGSTGLSPHAPYSLRPETFERCIQAAMERRCLVAMHLAETEEEEEFALNGTGVFAEVFAELGLVKDRWFPRGLDQQSCLRQLARVTRALVIHGNYLDARAITQLTTTMTVVYCPRTHHYFRHRRHPVVELLDAGVRVALGTDSRGSSPDLDLGGEVRFLLRHRQDLRASQVLRMATVSGAEALGLSSLGRLVPGSCPGLLVVPLSNDRSDPWECLGESLAEGASVQWLDAFLGRVSGEKVDD